MVSEDSAIGESEAFYSNCHQVQQLDSFNCVTVKAAIAKHVVAAFRP